MNKGTKDFDKLVSKALAQLSHPMNQFDSSLYWVEVPNFKEDIVKLYYSSLFSTGKIPMQR